MGPSQEHGIVETTHLVEQTFEETLAAARGLVMADFWAGAAPKAVLQGIVSAGAS
jgi:hypothetical protein